MIDINRKHPSMINLNHVMGKPVDAICEQQRRRLTCAFTDKIVSLPVDAVSEVSSLLFLAEQPNSSHNWSQKSEGRFSHDAAHVFPDLKAVNHEMCF